MVKNEQKKAKMWKSLQFYVDKRVEICYNVVVFRKKTKKRYTLYEEYSR